MQERDTLAHELEAGQAGNLENLQLFQRELSRKMESAENADQSLGHLQEQFLAYRNDKHAQETGMTKQIEQLAHELKKERSMKEREIEFARLAAETDKMSMKSACEVRIEMLVKEKEALILQMEQFKDIIQRQKDDMALEKIRYATDPEKESLRQQLRVLEQD